MRCKGMASERGWKAPFRSGAQNTLGLPQAGPRGPLEPFQGIITSGGAKWYEFPGPARAPTMLLLAPTLCCALALGGRLPRCVCAAGSSSPLCRAAPPMAQLVRIPRDENDGDCAGDGGGDVGGDGTILSVSQVADADGRTLEATGRSVASVQFMITRAMRRQLTSLGYTPEEVDRMDPPRAAAILAQRVPSSKQAQTRSRDHSCSRCWEQ